MGDEKRSWSKEETFLLIAQFERRPELWDSKNKNYKNRTSKQNALRALAALFNTNENNIQRKLHNLRTQFHQEIRKIAKRKSGSGADEKYESSWEYYKALRFIQADHSKPPTLDNLETKSDVLENNQATAEEPKPQLQKGNQQSKKNKAATDYLLSRAIRLMEKPVDEFQVFGDFVATELRNLKSKEHQRQLKRTIQRAILAISELDDTEQTASASSST